MRQPGRSRSPWPTQDAWKRAVSTPANVLVLGNLHKIDTTGLAVVGVGEGVVLV
jgi:hypothetical protein